jgi:hypothetical protein
MSKVTTICMDDDTENLVKSYLAITGESMSVFASRAMRELIEDELDSRDLVDAIKRNEGKPRLAHKDMLAKSGLS